MNLNPDNMAAVERDARRKDTTTRMRFTVGEIEHDSDLDDAIERIRAAGGTVVQAAADYSSETAAFVVDVAAVNVDRFIKVRRDTEFIY